MVGLQLARTCTKLLYPMLVTPFKLGGLKYLKYMHIKPNPQNLGLFYLYCHCMKNVCFGSFSGPYFSAFRYCVSLHIQFECGETWTRKTANVDLFHAVC